MNGLTHSRAALVKSVELNPHRFDKSSSPLAVGILFRLYSGRVSTRTRTFTLKHTLRQFSVPVNLNPRSTANHRLGFTTAMNPDSDSYLKTSEIETTMAKTSDDGLSLDEHSVIADEETRDADQNEVKSDANENEVEASKTADERASSSSLDGQSVVADTENVVEGEQRKVLPEELSRSVVMLSCESSVEGGNCDVYMVGTAHVSMVSCQEVEAVIRFLKPQVVFLELCANRVAILTPQNLKVPTMGEMVDMWKKNHNMFGIIYSWFLAKVACRLEVFPGSEFRVAYEEAMTYGGKVVLGDRPVNAIIFPINFLHFHLLWEITLRRTWSKMPLWHKTKLIYSLMFQSLFLPSPLHLNEMLKELDDVDMLTLVIQEMSKKYPTLMETLVHERDQYMSSSLLKVAREHSSVVAVVGKGHLQGIKKYWKQPVDVKELLELPSAKPGISVTKVLSTVGVAVAGVAIISGIYISSRK